MSKITVQKINDIKIKPLKETSKIEVKPAKGHEMFSDPYTQLAILSRKKSGKSVLIGNIIKKCAQPGYSTVIVFSTTVQKDPAWLALAKYCKRKGIAFKGLQEIVSVDGNGVKKDFLQEFMRTVLKTGEEEVIDSEASSSSSASEEDGSGSEESEPNSSEYSSEEEQSQFNFNMTHPSKPIKFLRDTPSIKREYPTISPQWVLCFDDISDELKRPSVQALMRKNRHLKSMCIYSSQDARDVVPSGHRNMDAFCLFGALDDSILEKIKRDAGLSVPLDTLMKMYRTATKEKYSFLTIDVPLEQYRIGFSKIFNITNKDANSEKTN